MAEWYTHYHLYWGTAQENRQDAVSNGSTSIWERTVKKYGEDIAREMNRRNGNKNGSGNKGKLKSDLQREKLSLASKANWKKRKEPR